MQFQSASHSELTTDPIWRKKKELYHPVILLIHSLTDVSELQTSGILYYNSIIQYIKQVPKHNWLM